MDKFINMYSMPTEKWWELYWKSNLILFDDKNNKFMISSFDIYFLQFRSRNRQP